MNGDARTALVRAAYEKCYKEFDGRRGAFGTTSHGSYSRAVAQVSGVRFAYIQFTTRQGALDALAYLQKSQSLPRGARVEYRMRGDRLYNNQVGITWEVDV